MIPFTAQQRRAIEATGQSVIVTAAAGSGKTAVLSERCAHLVCDLPPEQRCRVDELLVVTFTEAAAAEMKARILEAIRRRAKDRPEDAHIRAQAALVDTAQISTIHSFCLWILRRWFSEASIDPAATVLDEEEARLLRSEALEALFTERYGQTDRDAGIAFQRLVDDYGLGEDGTLADAVLRIATFLESLPDPLGWLAAARDAVGGNADATVAAFEDDLRREILRQEEHVRAIASYIIAHLPIGTFYGRKLEDYADRLRRWAEMPDLDEVRREISGYKIDLREGSPPKLTKQADPAIIAARDAAKDLLESIRGPLFVGRLQTSARFTREEMRDGLAKVAPYLSAVTELVTSFRQRYTRAKRAQDALDFSDLERGAYDLLHDAADSGGSSPVARELQARFAHVLVDEFQDINPIQAAILRLASREAAADSANNLFCVGDVKQSIYRFRLAEPQLFQDRVESAPETAQSVCIGLQKNFRSSPELIDGVNLIFEGLMSKPIGGVDYDEAARLHAGIESKGERRGAPIEVHLLDRRVQHVELDDDDSGQRYVDANDPTQWKAIEREAYLIGSRLLAARRSGFKVDGRPLEWRDVAILLRSTVHTAGPLAQFLRRMGIPTHTDAAAGLFDTTEIRDLLALLRVLDNQRQDIPLASVLRSGVTGWSFNEDDLVAIRCHGSDRQAPFHEQVLQYVRDGENADLRARLSRFSDRLDRWRQSARRRPLADVIWSIYQESGYLAFVGGLPRGETRRGNLLALHQRARQFGTFRRQGLHRFLRFVESLQSLGRDLATGASLGESQDVVQVMSIHKAKGLEFPVVFVADLGRRFNLTDARSRIIFDRGCGVGLRVVDPERMIDYPSVMHTRVARSIESASRSEELRVLYVALTRAKQKLVLVGSRPLKPVGPPGGESGLPRPPVSSITLEAAGTPLDWLIATLESAGQGAVAWHGSPPPVEAGSGPRVQVLRHTDRQMSEWHPETFDALAENPAAVAAAHLAPLPEGEPGLADATHAAALLDRLDYAYPHLAASSVRAVLGASEAKRPLDPTGEEYRATNAPPGGRDEHSAFDPPAVLSRGDGQVSPQQRGTLMHRVLENIDLAVPVGSEVDRLIGAGILSTEEAGAIDVEAVRWFMDTPLGRRLRAAGNAYRREFSFISAEPAEVFDPGIDAADDDTVLVRGIADGVLSGDNGLEVIDFKTDAIDAEGVAERVERYRMQMQLYARAVARIWRRPVQRSWLVFLTPRRVVEVPQEQVAP